MTTQYGLVCMLCVCVLRIHRSGLNDTQKYCLPSCQSGMWFAGLKKVRAGSTNFATVAETLKTSISIICLLLEYITAGREKGSKRTQGKNCFDTSGAELHNTVIRCYEKKRVAYYLSLDRVLSFVVFRCAVNKGL